MSHKATVWAIEQNVPALQKLVLIILADRHNSDTDRCDPSIARVARDCGMSHRSVQNAIAALHKRGLVTTVPRKSGQVNLPNTYTLHLDRGGAGDTPPLQGRSIRGASPARVVHAVHEGGAPDAGGVVHAVHEGGAPDAYEPVTEPGIEPKSTSAPRSYEHDAAAPQLQVKGSLPVLSGKQWTFTVQDLTDWADAYPAIDVLQHLREMREWLKANPRNQKTLAGMRRFVTGWLAKEQNRAPRSLATFERPAERRLRSEALVGMHDTTGAEAPVAAAAIPAQPAAPDVRALARAAHLRKMRQRRELNGEEKEFLRQHEEREEAIRAWRNGHMAAVSAPQAEVHA